MTLPLTGEPTTVPFTGRRLLDRALVVVRFTPVLKIGDETGSGIAAFQEAIRSDYPLAQLEHEAVMRVEVSEDGNADIHAERQPVWRLSDIDKHWRVSLTSQSFALDVDGHIYTNWADLATRVSKLITAVGEHFAPSHRQYIGVRYVNAAPVDNDSDPRTECAPELVSITGTSGLEVADLLWRFRTDEGHLMLRSGVMPAMGTYEPSVFKPRDASSWYLDIDVANSDTVAFEASQISAGILAQVKRLHAIYLWAMPSKQGEM